MSNVFCIRASKFRFQLYVSVRIQFSQFLRISPFYYYNVHCSDDPTSLLLCMLMFFYQIVFKDMFIFYFQYLSDIYVTMCKISMPLCVKCVLAYSQKLIGKNLLGKMELIKIHLIHFNLHVISTSNVMLFLQH